MIEERKVWTTPELSELDISETANGTGGNDGQGQGGQGANSSGS